MNKKKNLLVLLFLATMTLFTACSDDDDGGTTPVIETTGSVEVGDQTLMNGMLTVSNVEISDDGWLVIYRDNAGILGSEVLGYSHIEAGNHQNITVELDENVEITNGETFWAALHVDSDQDGEFDWDGITGTDLPVTSGIVQVSQSFTVNTDSSITVVDQAVTDNTITAGKVSLAEAGWVVVHAETEGAPGDVIGVSEVLTAGSHNDVTISLDEDVSVGDVLWIMLHSDTGASGTYEFDGVNGLDLPITDDDGVIMTSITITE